MEGCLPGWTLVRRVQRGGAWHPATDRCDGSGAYDDEQKTNDPTENAVSGNFNGQYENAQRRILSSSKSDSPYTAAWYYRQGNPEDPWHNLWISVIDHASAIGAGMLVYGETSFDWAGHTQVLQDHTGANVFVEKTKVLS